ncbi:MAG: hypothetical protein J6I73_01030 [Treponema sp.]|nr:hypothetical protein [Treponema sp.]
MMKKKVLLAAAMLALFATVFAQEAERISIDFRNQKVTDIILAVADMCGKSVSIDDTVSGNATFHFEDTDFDTAIRRFAESARLYITVREGVYHITKVKIEARGGGYYIDGEDVPVVPFLTRLSRDTHVTIMYDALPNVTVTVRTQEASMDDILNLVLTKLAGYNLEPVAGGYFISKSATRTASGREDFNIYEKDGLYTLQLKKATMPAVIDFLFKKAGREYSLLNKNAAVLENMFYADKEFDALLHLIMEQSNSDFSVSDGIYYVFEIQRRDVLKKLKETRAVKLENVSAEAAAALFPTELNAASFSRIDKNTNTIYITGSADETQPIIDFLAAIDIPAEGRYWQSFSTSSIPIKDAVPLIPKNMLYSDAVIVPGSMTFVTQVTEEKEQQLRDYLALIDKREAARPVHLRYIQSEELLKYLPPSVSKENVSVTGDTSLVFFTGGQEAYDAFKRELEVMDRPKQQVRYQVLVIQHQKTGGMRWNPEFKIERVSSTGTGLSYAATLGSLLNVNFDIVSQFGIRFAASLDWEISEGKARVLADTTLNGISGETITFSNTNVYRYRDIVRDNSSNVYSSTTREISSGLALSIKGWVSGDGMITVDVNAQVSKQGTSNDTSIPPPTSEKKVTTNVRTKSGSPIVIGGLIQTEKDVSVQRVPVLGSIPLLGNLFKKKIESTADTEFVIYLVPFIERTGTAQEKTESAIKRYYEKYVAQGA